MPCYSTVEDARGILEGDFLSPDLIQRELGMEYSGDQIALLEKTLPNDYKLRQSREQNVMLVAGPVQPLTIAEICKLSPESFGDSAQNWSVRQGNFGTETVNPGWMLFGKKLVVGSRRLTWHEMKELVVYPRFIPNVAEVAWAIVVWKALHGAFLFPDEYACTATSRCIGRHTMIGHCGSENRINVMEHLDDEPAGYIGIAQAQKKFSR